MVILFFTLGSIGAQSVSAADLNNSKSLKFGSISSNSTKATASSITNKVKANVTKKTTNVTKASSNKTKEAKTTINKKTLAKTSTNFVNYVEKNGKFPKVKISNKNYSSTEYLYLLTKAVENDSNSKIEIKKNLVKKYNNTNIRSVKGTLNKTEYVKMAGKTRKFIEKNKRAPNWVSSSKGNVPYNQLILSYSKCLDFFNKNNRLPNTIKLDDLDLDKIKSKINKNETKTSSNSSVKTTNTTKKTTTSTKTTKTNTTKKTTTSTKTTKTNTTKKTTTSTKTTKTTSKETKNSSANASSNKNGNADGNAGLVEITMNQIHNLLNNILDRLDPSKYKIDLTKADEANVKLNTSKINVDVKGKSSINVKVSANNAKTNATKKTTTSTKATKTNATKSTSGKTSNAVSKTVSKTSSKSLKLNDTYIKESLKKYLSSSRNCQIGNKEIKALAKKLTSTLKSDFDKGKKLFNWVRDNIQYKKYRNTRRGAVKTLQSKKGNCVDQSHLLVALSRAAGIPARYVKGDKCRFTTGYVSGHIWTQILVGNKWVVADPTSSRNSFGKIKNWNTKNYVLCGKYSSISF